jgi:hypothetical protein
MSGQDWSIKIVPGAGGLAAFEPDLMGAKPGDPLQTTNADLISWNNRTGQEHQPWPATSNYTPLLPQDVTTGPTGNYLSDPIPPWEPSTPAYLTTAPSSGSTTIYYVCKNHPDEQGTIIVSAG